MHFSKKNIIIVSLLLSFVFIFGCGVKKTSSDSNISKNKKKMSSFNGLSVALEMAKQSTAIQVLGDSTGDGKNEWVHLMAQDLAKKYPAFYVEYRLWDDTKQDYLKPEAISTPAKGKVRIGGGKQTRYLPNSAIPHVAGDIDIRAKLKLPNWKPASTVTPISRFGAVASERAWYFSILPDGRLLFVFTPDGTTMNTLISDDPVTLTNGSLGWIRVYFDVNNGVGGWSATFYQSNDGVNWKGLKTTNTTTTGTAVLNNAVGDYEIGGRGQSGEILPAGAELYEVDIRDGQNGFSVAPRYPDLWFDRLNGLSHVVSGAPVLEIVNGSKIGANIDYLSEATRHKKLMPNYGQSVVIVSDSHNEGAFINKEFKTKYITFLDTINSRLSDVPIVLTAQNPQSPKAKGNIEQAIRRKNIFEIGSKKNMEVLDVYKAFMPDPTLYLLDSVHPNSTGSILWKNVVMDAMP